MSTVLVVEDEPNVRKLVAVNLSSRGHAVLEAGDVQQALAQLHTTTPDLMVLDIKLPDLTGWDLLARITVGAAQSVRFPVVVMTASIMDAQVDLEQYPVVVEVLVKPFSVVKLVAAVERALRTRIQS
ncbi:MAG: response regulator [Chloroflexi bacterium]|nr:response regulator [Chloroflexota bacterium]